jgi:hypothetical protein
LKKVGVFFGGEKMEFCHYVYHAIHHELTSKLPRSRHCFSQNTPQKGQEESISRILSHAKDYLKS